MDFGKLADWVRERLLDFLPDWLDFVPATWPDWALFLVAPTVVLIVIGLVLNRVFVLLKDSKKGYETAGRFVRGKFEDPSPATLEGQAAIQREMERLRDESASTRATLNAVLAAVTPPLGTEALDAEAMAAKKSAVARLVADNTPAAQQATHDLVKGHVATSFDVLQREARAAEAEAVEKWLRLGALATGVDTITARAAYEEAFRLQPHDFWTCIALCRLRMEAGDLESAAKAAFAADEAIQSPRERLVSKATLGDVLMKAGDLSGAKERFEESLKVSERLAQQNPGSAEAQRDVWVSMWRLAGIDGSWIR
jgi:tetratricopeptide (TPR) repeat protein